VAAGAYAAYAATAWTRFGSPAPPSPDDDDDLLARFMPRYDVVERHHVKVNAPAATTLAAATAGEIDSAVSRAIFRAREILLGATPDTVERPRAFLAAMQSIGWTVLEATDREVVVGAATRPWEANPQFRRVPPEDFLAFAEPAYVKIALTLRADPIDPTQSIFRTETRALATDDEARRRFRWYWSLLSPGIVLIRWTLLSSVKAEAERRYAGGWSVRDDADDSRVRSAAH
jgi:hypothetical protein